MGRLVTGLLPGENAERGHAHATVSISQGAFDRSVERRRLQRLQRAQRDTAQRGIALRIGSNGGQPLDPFRQFQRGDQPRAGGLHRLRFAEQQGLQRRADGGYH